MSSGCRNARYVGRHGHTFDGLCIVPFSKLAAMPKSARRGK